MRIKIAPIALFLALSLAACSSSKGTGGNPIPDQRPAPPAAAAPAAPSQLVAIPVSSSQVNLSWVDNSAAETAFIVERKSENADFAILATLAANQVSYPDTGLTSRTQYIYRVKAVRETSASAYTPEVRAVTFDSPLAEPAAPDGLSAQAGGSQQLNLTWRDNSNDEQGFKIERAPDNAGNPGTFAEIAQVNANIHSYLDDNGGSGLTPLTTYHYRVRAWNSAGDSPFSGVAHATTQATATSPPAAPSDLRAAAASKSAINVSWKDNANNESGFILERMQEGGTWQQIPDASTMLPADTLSYADAGLAALTTYSYRIRAHNEQGDSGWSNVDQDTTSPSTGAAAIAVGANHTCATLTDGRAKCWGLNSSGQLGDGTTTNKSVPTSVGAPAANLGGITALTNLTGITTGEASSCVVMDDGSEMNSGSVWCWGNNLNGTLGNTPPPWPPATWTPGPSSSVPVQVVDDTGYPISGLSLVSAGSSHVCAVWSVNEGGVGCWGYGWWGQLGYPLSGNQGFFSSTRSALWGAPSMISMGGRASCALVSGTVKCWGWLGKYDTADNDPSIMIFNYPSANDVPFPAGDYPIAVAVGETHICAIVGSTPAATAGQVKCWGVNGTGGVNNNGALGDGTTVNKANPAASIAVAGITDAVEIGAAAYSTCVRRLDGSVWCWGSNANGHLGIGEDPTTTPYVTSPRQVTGLGGAVIRLAVGANHTCAVRSDLTVLCWGNNSSGQLGIGNQTDQSSPQVVSGL